MMMQWRKSDRYEDGWFLGSEGEDGDHLRDESGWPFSIYRKAKAVGVIDSVLCHGIQARSDAAALLRLLNNQNGN